MGDDRQSNVRSSGSVLDDGKPSGNAPLDESSEDT